jgi:hypothetical protein
MLRIRANGVLFPWVPKLRNPRFCIAWSWEGGQHETAHLDRTVVIAGCKEVRGRVHDTIDGYAGGGTRSIDAPPAHSTHSCTLGRVSDTVPVLVSMVLSA